MKVLPAHDCKGIHILADFWGVDKGLLCDPLRIGRALEEAALAGGATILDTRLHSFGQEQGVTGVALLAESHLSIHTWPEQQIAAIDIYMCGATHADLALLSLKASLQPTQSSYHRLERGLRPSNLVPTHLQSDMPDLVAELSANVR